MAGRGQRIVAKTNPLAVRQAPSFRPSPPEAHSPPGRLTLDVRDDYDPTKLPAGLSRPLSNRASLGVWLGTILLTACAQVDAKAQHSPSEAGVVPITTQQGITIWAEVADTLPKRARGLMFRDSLASDRSMLFIFPEPQLWVIWMKNTRIPLDIIWLDRDKRVVHVESNVPICRRTDEGCPQYQPNKKASYVLELNAGRAASLKLEKGARLTFTVEPRDQPPR